MPSLPKPTEAEVAILRVLWRRGPSTVREVLEEMPKGTGYTTVLKFLQIMTEKRLVVCDSKERSHVFRAALPEQQTLRGLAGDLLDRAFGGSAKKLLVAALAARRATPDEIKEMRKLLEEAEENERGST